MIFHSVVMFSDRDWSFNHAAKMILLQNRPAGAYMTVCYICKILQENNLSVGDKRKKNNSSVNLLLRYRRDMSSRLPSIYE